MRKKLNSRAFDELCNHANQNEETNQIKIKVRYLRKFV